MRIRTLLILLVLAPALHAGFVIRNARVFDGAAVLPAGTEVLVEAGKIAAVGVRLPVAEGTEVFDGSGKTLLPGLIDAHTHSFGTALTDALMFGVTANFDQFTIASWAAEMRADQDAGKADGRADLFSSGVLVTAPKGHGTEYGFEIPTITSPGEAQAFVDARIAEGSDWIKIVYDDGRTYGRPIPTVSRETMRAVIDAAHRRKKLAVVHVATLAGARDAIEAGADGLVHLFADRGPDAGFAKLVAERGAFVIPTLVVVKSITGVAGGAPLNDDPRLRPYLHAAARTQLGQAFRRPAGLPALSYPAAEESVRQLAARGVPILAGSDAPNPGTAHGAALHRELDLLVAAGLTPVQALAAATSVPARAFRITDRGRIVKGLRADLLLVNGDPTRDITATRDIAAIWKGGVPVQRAAYAKAVAAANDAAAAAPAGIDAKVLSDFDSGAPSAAFGTAWTPTSDEMVGGKSKGTVSVVDGALAIAGTIDPAVPYAWYGAMWSPTAVPMQPANLSSAPGLRFRTKGDGKTYRVMLFTRSGGPMPLIRTFVAGAEWSEVVMPWKDFGTDGREVMAVIFAGGPETGPFALQVDQVSLR